MTKYTTGALVLVTVLFVMQVPVEPCSDEFINSPSSRFGLNFKGTLGDIEREFQHLVGNFEEDLLLKKPNKNNPKVQNVTPSMRPIHLSGFRDRSRHPKRRFDDAGKAMIVKRGVMAEFRECCVKKCTVKDLNHICEKK